MYAGSTADSGRRPALSQRGEERDRHGDDGGLGVDRQVELLGRAVEREVADRLTKGGVRLGHDGRGRRRGLDQGLAHAYGLGALTGEYEGNAIHAAAVCLPRLACAWLGCGRAGNLSGRPVGSPIVTASREERVNQLRETMRKLCAGLQVSSFGRTLRPMPQFRPKLPSLGPAAHRNGLRRPAGNHVGRPRCGCRAPADQVAAAASAAAATAADPASSPARQPNPVAAPVAEDAAAAVPPACPRSTSRAGRPLRPPPASCSRRRWRPREAGCRTRASCRIGSPWAARSGGTSWLGFAAQLGELNLGFTQLAALYVLADSGTMTVADLADTLGRSPSAVSRMVDGLVKRQLVERRQDSEDRRQRTLTLTGRGLALLGIVDRARAQEFLAIVRPLPTAERALVAMGVAALSTHAISRRGRLIKQRPAK